MKLLTKTLVLSAALTLTYAVEARTSYMDCSSINHTFRRCYSNEPIASAQVDVVYSSADCVRGQTWGHNRESIWVAKGCRARFQVESGFHAAEVVRDVVCESINHNNKRCYVNGIITNSQLIAQYSHANCNFRSTWTWGQDHLLVTNGCRGLFRVRFRPYR